MSKDPTRCSAKAAYTEWMQFQSACLNAWEELSYVERAPWHSIAAAAIGARKRHDVYYDMLAREFEETGKRL